MIYLRVRPSVGVPETLDGKPCGAVLVMLLLFNDFRLAKKPGLIKPYQAGVRRGGKDTHLVSERGERGVWYLAVCSASWSTKLEEGRPASPGVSEFEIRGRWTGAKSCLEQLLVGHGALVK